MSRASRPFTLAAAVLVVILTGCPNPITDDIVLSAKDAESPSILVTTPSEYSSYSRVIRIEGVVLDGAGGGRSGRVSSLSYEILSYTAEKSATVSSSGAFVIEEPNDLRTNITVLLKAVDWNGNAAEYRLPLVYPGNDIPSFQSEEDSRSVTLTWDPVPGATRYRLYVEPSSKTPDPGISTYFDDVTSPHTLNQLANGSVYSLLLAADGPGGRVNYSQVVRSVPLSRMHLLPRATERYDGIALSWRTFESIPSYTVLRSASPAGPWEDVSGPVVGSGYFDASASGGRRYYYAVKPTSRSTVVSEYIEAASDSVSSRQDAPVAVFDGVENSQSSAYKDGYLYIADFYGGLRVLDVRNPGLPTQAGFLALTQVQSVVLDEDEPYAYLGGYRWTGTAWAIALFIVDIGNPSMPSIAGYADLDPSGFVLQPESVAVLGNLAFVAGFNSGLYVVDVTNKSAPAVRIQARDAALLGQAYDVTVQNRSGTRLVAVAGNSATAVYTVTGTDAVPTVTRNSSSISGAGSVAFAASGTVLYAAQGSFVRAWQTSNPASPSALSAVEPGGSSVLVGELTVSGNRVFAAMNIYGYSVVDVSNPSSLRTAFTRNVPGSTEHVAVGDGYSFVSTGRDYPFRIYGANDPSAAVLVNTQTGLRSAARLAAFGGRLYVSEYSADWTSSVFSLEAPAVPARVATDAGGYTPYDFSFAGERSYIAAERSGVMQWSLQTPGAPTHAPQVLPPWYVSTQGGNAWSVALFGNYALMGTSNSWLNVVDLSRASQGFLTVVAAVTTQPSPGANREARRIALAGSYAFVANEAAGVRAVSVQDPEFPSALAGYGSPWSTGETAAVAVYGDYVLAADTLGGLLVYEASNPRSWSAGGTAHAWRQPSAVPAFDLAVRGSYAYVAYGAAGLGIWEISNPLAPLQVGTVQAAGFEPRSLTIYGDYLYAADGGSKLYTVSLRP